MIQFLYSKQFSWPEECQAWLQKLADQAEMHTIISWQIITIPRLTGAEFVVMVELKANS